MYSDILAYQELDLKLSNLKKKSDSHPKVVEMKKLAQAVKDSRNELVKCDELAKKQLAMFNEGKKEYDKIYEEIKILSDTMKNMSDDELELSIDRMEKLYNELTRLARLFFAQEKKIQDLVKNFDNQKLLTINLLNKHKQCKQQNELIQKDFDEKQTKLEKEMKSMEKGLNPRIFSKYLELKQDMELPVFVPYNNSNWCACGMEIPAALMNKLKEDGYLVCEQCGKYILYSNK